MKRKKILWLALGSFVLLLGVIGFTIRYQKVNRHSNELGVKQEIFFRQGEFVKAHHVNFKVDKTTVKKDSKMINLTLKLFIKQTGEPNYGFRKGNPAFLEDMWFNIPYSLCNQTYEAYDRNGKRTPPHKLLEAKQPITIHFFTPVSEYYDRNQKIRFSFLVPVSRHFVKYSLLLE